MNKRTYKHWTTGEIALLQNLFLTGLTDTTISKKLRRTISSVESQRKKCGLLRNCGVHQRRCEWTIKEVATLRELAKIGLSNQEIADCLQKSKAAVEHQKTKYGLSIQRGRKWEKWEDEVLLSLPKVSSKIVAERLSRTEESVKQRRKVLRKRKK